MPITQLELARRLRSARKACHITQVKAARALGISRSAVSQMETGQRGVSGLELHQLAQLYQRDVRDFLENRFEETNPVTAIFRAHPELRGIPPGTRESAWDSGPGPSPVDDSRVFAAHPQIEVGCRSTGTCRSREGTAPT